MTTRATDDARNGFTLVESLVAITIIAVLLGILLPAVQRVRDSSYRAACLNHLKQLGIANQGYHDARSTFPPGLTHESGQHPQPYLSWQARLLPHIEQGDLWRQTEEAFAQDKDFLHNPPHTASIAVVKLFSCPSDSRSSRPNKYGKAFTMYLGVEGTNQFTRDGILFRDSRVRLADITDGASTTLLAGERPPSADEKFGWWYAGWGQDQDGSAEMVLGVRERLTFQEYVTECTFGPYHFGPGRVSDNCSTFHFWSLHAGGGAHFLFADGSVQFLKYAADPLMHDLATRAGKESVTLD